jgi:hypothetical protein
MRCATNRELDGVDAVEGLFRDVGLSSVEMLNQKPHLFSFGTREYHGYMLIYEGHTIPILALKSKE